jgi:DNA-binding NtrC family response regulator
MLKALVIDDEADVRKLFELFLSARGYEVISAASGAEGGAVAKKYLPDLVFLDQNLPDMHGDALLPLLVSSEIGACVMMITGHVEVDHAVRAMKQGAEYYFPKPVDMEHLTVILESVEIRLRRKYEAGHHRHISRHNLGAAEIIGRSSQIIKVQRLVSLLARNVATPALIMGESGSGKELVARAIHHESGVVGPLVEINSASLSEALLESELFGHEKGAFTDAGKCKRGLFELAHNGTIFFDELAEMPLVIQAKLLKVLDTKTFRRVGGLTDLQSNARFIGATNRNLATLVKRGLFREDLFYRINVLPITLPPLRERGEDIPLLVDHYIERLSQEMGRAGIMAAADFLDVLQRYSWPGNVRELRNVIERAIIIADGPVMTSAHLPLELGAGRPLPLPTETSMGYPTLREVEDDHIRRTLQHTGNNFSRTAALLGISRSTLHVRLKSLPR